MLSRTGSGEEDALASRREAGSRSRGWLAAAAVVDEVLANQPMDVMEEPETETVRGGGRAPLLLLLWINLEITKVA